MQLSERAWHSQQADSTPESPLDNNWGHLPIHCKQMHVVEEIVGVVVIGKACKAFSARSDKNLCCGTMLVQSSNLNPGASREAQGVTVSRTWWI